MDDRVGTISWKLALSAQGQPERTARKLLRFFLTSNPVLASNSIYLHPKLLKQSYFLCWTLKFSLFWLWCPSNIWTNKWPGVILTLDWHISNLVIITSIWYSREAFDSCLIFFFPITKQIRPQIAMCIWSTLKYDFQAPLTYSAFLYGNLTNDLRMKLYNILVFLSYH